MEGREDRRITRSGAAVRHPQRAGSGGGGRRRRPVRAARAALGDERPARREQAGRHQRAVEDGAVHPVLEQLLLPPHLGHPHPPGHLPPVPLQPLPRAHLLVSCHRRLRRHLLLPVANLGFLVRMVQ